MPNQLIEATSPYLLQHAHNPVDWRPWGDAAMALARTSDKPIFLSIGYSACHWCHVMERESFENVETAEFLNAHFISIKVDREERPDLDQIYMQAVMALRGGHGGWPLSAFLTPAGHVFFGGTYWPPEPRFGMPSFRQILERVAEVFRTRREEVEAQAQEITAWLGQLSAARTSGSGALTHSSLSSAARRLVESYDFAQGGFGGAPKFPHSMQLDFLLRWSQVEDQHQDRETWVNVVAHNLECMYRGGIYDHLGGGFARYSVDDQWLVPHFEKMLYDNALLAKSYLMAGQAFHRPDFVTVGRETLDYLLRDMRHPDGGFYSAEDADSEGVEGKFYVWDRREIEALLDAHTARVVCEVYGVTHSGNFEGRNILHLAEPVDHLARRWGQEIDDLTSALQTGRELLLGARSRRVRPLRDEKILTNWNALAISAFSAGAVVCDEPRYYRAAQQAWGFVEQHLMAVEGGLLHSWMGKPGPSGFLDDYAFSVAALLDLYMVEFDERYLERAADLAATMLELFGDEPSGGLYFTGSHAEQLIVRLKEFQESSIPSGNAMAACALVRLARYMDQPEWAERALAIVQAGSGLIETAPLACGQLLVAASELVAPRPEIVLVSQQPIEDATKRALQLVAMNGSSVVMRDGHANRTGSPWLDWHLRGREQVGDEATLFVCHQGACGPPIVGVQQIEQVLKTLT